MLRRVMLAVFVAAVAAVVLAGCGANDVATTASQGATTITQGVDTLSKTSLGELSGQLPSIEAAVEAGNTAEARTAFSTFLSAWDAIKEQVKTVAPESATSIQTAMDNVKQTLIDTPTPNADDVKAALNELETQFTNLSNTLQ
jgi:hypothetical protein